MRDSIERPEQLKNLHFSLNFQYISPRINLYVEYKLLMWVQPSANFLSRIPMDFSDVVLTAAAAAAGCISLITITTNYLLIRI